MNKSYYPSGKIKTLDELSQMLGIKVSKLLSIANRSQSYYKPNPQLKKDNSLRITYSVKEPLKYIQSKIKRRILDRVCFAEYLFAGIPKKQGVKENAAYHCRQGKPLLLIKIDIKQFYPSITENHVFNIWHEFFKFPKEVSMLLTRLTTEFNQLPQGVSTSSHLSNLIFCPSEHRLVRLLSETGATYTRYADDIDITLHDSYEKISLEKIISAVIGFLGNYGFKCHRGKFEIITNSQRMLINNSVCINNGLQSANKEKRKKLKKRVCEYMEAYQDSPENPRLVKEYQSIMGQIYHILSIYPHEDCRKLLNKLICKR